MHRKRFNSCPVNSFSQRPRGTSFKRYGRFRIRGQKREREEADKGTSHFRLPFAGILRGLRIPGAAAGEPRKQKHSQQKDCDRKDHKCQDRSPMISVG